MLIIELVNDVKSIELANQLNKNKKRRVKMQNRTIFNEFITEIEPVDFREQCNETLPLN